MHGSLKNTYMFVIFLQKNICDAIICQYVWSIHIDQGIGDQGQIQMVSCCCDANTNTHTNTNTKTQRQRRSWPSSNGFLLLRCKFWQRRSSQIDVPSKLNRNHSGTKISLTRSWNWIFQFCKFRPTSLEFAAREIIVPKRVGVWWIFTPPSIYITCSHFVQPQSNRKCRNAEVI